MATFHMTWNDNKLELSLKHTLQLKTLTPDWKVRIFSVINDRVVLFAERAVGGDLKVHAFRLSDKGRIVENRSLHLPIMLTLGSTDGAYWLVKSHPKKLESMAMPDIEDSLAVCVLKESKEYIMLVKPDKPFMEMFPYLMGPTNQNEKYFFARHIHMEASSTEESIGFLVTDSGLSKDRKAQVNHYFTLFRNLKMALKIETLFIDQTIFRAQKTYEEWFSSTVFTYVSPYNGSNFSGNSNGKTQGQHSHSNSPQEKLYQLYLEWLKENDPQKKKESLRVRRQIRR